MSGSFGITYKQVLPKVFLPAGLSVAKHGPNNGVPQVGASLANFSQNSPFEFLLI
jgi:hypothetical protein